MNRSHLAAIAGKSLKILAVAFGIGLIVYILLVAWLHHNLAGQAVSISQAAGAPVEAEHVLHGLLSWLLAITLVPSFFRLVAECLNPFRSGATIILKIVLIIALVTGYRLLPHGLQVLRGVDAQGLPVQMQQSDPAAALWWLPDGKPVLFYSREDDGSIRFWNRNGTTPDSGTTSIAVTRKIRQNWEQQRSSEAAEKERRLREDADAKAEQEKEMAARIQSATDELKQRAASEALKEREAREAKHAQELASLEEQREAGVAKAERFAGKREQLQRELDAAREVQRQEAAKAARKEVVPVIPPTKTSIPKKVNPPSQSKTGYAWETKRILPGMYLNITGYPYSPIEIRLPYECEIQIQGQSPRVYLPGTIVLNLPARGNFRMRSRAGREFNILIRRTL